eukprot:gnl/Carplike_NY0171/1609_a2174_692.p1 GENE.gnl/Carplike_NY0171/1609_a2174_692~~gnl/Carplike_NY0171/1609_a2174_692.p1  ORF type:complete len:790 (-),score=256.30 gnl/Carplike_NY0171/1609_a2174_692:370-2739(-)
MGFSDWKKKFSFKKASSLELHDDARRYLEARRFLFVSFREFSKEQELTTYFSEPSEIYDPLPGLYNGELFSKFVNAADQKFRVAIVSSDETPTSLTKAGTKNIKAILKWAADEGFKFDHPLASSLRISDLDASSSEQHALFVIQLADIIRWILLEYPHSSPLSAPVPDEEVSTYFTPEEISLATEIYGEDTVALRDVSKDLLNEPTIFNSGVFANCIVASFAAFGLGLITLALATHLKVHMNLMTDENVRDISNNDYTLYVSVFNIVQFFASVLLQGPISERIGRKWTFVIILIWYAITDVSFVWVNGRDGGYWAIVGIRAASGLAAVIAPLGYLCIADLAPPKARTLSMILYTGFIYIGMIFSYIVNRALVHNFLPDDAEDDDYINILKYAALISMASRIVALIIALIWMKESSPIVLANRELKAQHAGMKKQKEPEAEDAAIEMQASKKTEEETTVKEHKEFKHRGFWQVVKMLITNKNFVLLFIGYTMCVGAYSIVRDLNLSWLTDIPFSNLWENFGYQGDGTPTVLDVKSFGSDYSKWLSDFQFYNALVVYGSMTVFSFVVGPWMTKRAGELNLTFFSHVFNLLALLLQGITKPLVENVWPTAVYSAVGSFSEACAQAAYLGMLSLFSLPDNRGSVTGISQLGNSIGRAVPTLLIGYTFEAFQDLYYPVIDPIIAFNPITYDPIVTKYTFARTFPTDDSKGYYAYLTAIPVVFIGIIAQLFAKVPIQRHELVFRQSFVDEVRGMTKGRGSSAFMDLDKLVRMRNFSVAEKTMHKQSSTSFRTEDE